MNKSTMYLGAAVVLQWCAFGVLWYHFGFWMAQAIIVYPALIGILAGLGSVHAYKEFQESMEEFLKAPVECDVVRAPALKVRQCQPCPRCGITMLVQHANGLCTLCQPDPLKFLDEPERPTSLA